MFLLYMVATVPERRRKDDEEGDWVILYLR